MNLIDAADIVTTKPGLSSTIQTRAIGIETLKPTSGVLININPGSSFAVNETNETKSIAYLIPRTTHVVDTTFRTSATVEINP